MSSTQPQHIVDCERLIQNLTRTTYFPAVLREYDFGVTNLMATGVAGAWAHRLVLAHLHDILRGAQPGAEAIIRERINCGMIHNFSQAGKSVAGNVFQQLVAYSLAKNVLLGNITAPVSVALTGKNNPLIRQYASITVGDEVQKPDSDVLLFCPTRQASPIINFSCKTSCRERAGQTYKWKLLSDLATCSCEYKDGVRAGR